MRARYLFVSFAVFATVYAVLLIVAPGTVGNIGTVATEAEILNHINQSRAPTMLGLGVLAWMFRDRPPEPATAMALLALGLANGVLAVSTALSQFTAAATSSGWAIAAFHLACAVGFGYLRFGSRVGASHA